MAFVLLEVYRASWPDLASLVVTPVVKNPPADKGDTGSVPGSKWRRNWQPTPVFLPGKFHAQRSLVGCSPWGHGKLA